MSLRREGTAPMLVHDFPPHNILSDANLTVDPVMAEYITIMIINNKTPGALTAYKDVTRFLLTAFALTAQITSELQERMIFYSYACICCIVNLLTSLAQLSAQISVRHQPMPHARRH